MLKPPFYVIADTHFFHDNIVKFCGRHPQIEALLGPDTSKRIDHNEYMVERWNAVVKPEDTVLHLGDVFLWRGDGEARYTTSIMPRLNGKKYLILGNHDRPECPWDDLGYEVIEPFGTTIHGRKVTFDHYPRDPGTAWQGTPLRIHGHIHNNGYPKTKNWKDGSDPTSTNQINVSVEVVDYTPQSIDSLILGLRS